MIDWNRWYVYQQVMTPWQWALVIVGVSVAIWIILRVRSYFREDAEDADQTLEMLTQFRELHQEGGLSDDEFRLIRSRLASTAQGSRSTEMTKLKPTNIERGLPQEKDSQDETRRELPTRHATVEDEANSERMTEEKTD